MLRDFVDALISARLRDYSEEGLLAVVPFWGPYLLAVIPYLLAFETDYGDFDLEQIRNIQVVFVNLVLVASAVFGAFCITALVHTGNLSSQYPFSDFLIKTGSVDDFLFFPEYTIFRIILVIFWVSIISVVSPFLSEEWSIFVSASCIFSFLYISYISLEMIGLLRKLNKYYIQYMNDFNSSRES